MNKFKHPFIDLKAVNNMFRPELDEAVKNVMDSGRYIGGEQVDMFERELAAFCRAPYAVGVSNGLDALRLILRAWRELGLLCPGDGVVVPANTYIASVLAIVHGGLRPVLVDPDEKTMNLSAEGIERACTLNPGVRAVMPVHLYGRLAWDNNILNVVLRRELLVIEDAAQAIGGAASCKGLMDSRKAGALGHAGAFSFYPTKNIGAMGDGGAVVTHSKKLAETVRALAKYGRDCNNHYSFTGFNCRLDPIQAAVLRVKLPHTVHVNARRFERAVAYTNVINHPLVIKPAITPCVTDQVWHQYAIRVTGSMRDSMKRHLLDNGVETMIHYPEAPHTQPCLSSIPHEPLPLSERLATEMLSLPIADGTTVAEAAAIGRIINSFQPQT